MGYFDRLFRKQGDRDPLSWLNLEDQNLVPEGIVNDVRVWYTPDGDGVGSYFFGLSPDLPRNQPTVEAFFNRYRERFEVEVVETGIDRVANIPAVRIIGKVPQEPTGMTYVGSYTIPFRDCSYVVKIQCGEYGTTGMREAMLIEQGLASGKLELDESGALSGDWNPDAAQHDDDFPDHPLSRCRRGLRMIASSVSLHERLRRLPRFELPSH